MSFSSMICFLKGFHWCYVKYGVNRENAFLPKIQLYEAFREEQGKLPKQVQNCLERAGKGACHAFIAVDGWGWVRAPTSELLPGSDWGGTGPSYQLSKMRNKGKRIAVRLQTFCRETLKMESGYYISKLHSFAGKKNLMNKIFSILFLCDNF